MHILAGKNISSYSQNAVFFCLFSYNSQAVYKFTRYFSLVPGNGWLECSLIALIDYIMRGIKNLACIVSPPPQKTLAVTAGGETYQEVITQVPEVALTFELAFCMHYSEPLSLSVI